MSDLAKKQAQAVEIQMRFLAPALRQVDSIKDTMKFLAKRRAVEQFHRKAAEAKLAALQSEEMVDVGARQPQGALAMDERMSDDLQKRVTDRVEVAVRAHCSINQLSDEDWAVLTQAIDGGLATTIAEFAIAECNRWLPENKVSECLTRGAPAFNGRVFWWLRGDTDGTWLEVSGHFFQLPTPPEASDAE